jgi:ABC-type hemin transport system substrate-binding protein
MVTYGHPPPPFLAPPIASVTVNRPADGPAMIEEQDDEVAGMMHWAAKAEEVAQGFQARLRHVEEAYAEDDARRKASLDQQDSRVFIHFCE